MSAAVILQIATGLLGVISLWLRDYYSKDKVEQRKEQSEDDHAQKIRLAVASHDTSTIQCELDRMLSVELRNSASRVSSISDKNK